ncbi:Abhydrolase domain-containing protein [Smittium culicis]|uniref:Abhydrolase domain-containing protein n=1 Tax=Smittium culicis TaxID=133412 RepID=A0A1R1XTA0_9FUNG|nr:Abhydrolase domain-containing protein [Smittium culicis]
MNLISKSNSTSIRTFTSKTLPALLSQFKVGDSLDVSGPSPLLVLHGLFGSKKNWTSLAKRLNKELARPIIALDLRNHGDSPHISPHDYFSMSKDLLAYLDNERISNPVVIGHSMGGKVAMTASLLEPQAFSSVIIEDISPLEYNVEASMSKYIVALQEIVDSNVTSLKEADQIMQKFESEMPVRQFVLTNLYYNKDEKAYRSKIPLHILGNSLMNLSDWVIGNNRTFTKPSLLIGGSRSNYITPDGISAFKNYYTNSQIEFLDAGHWVHSEKPEEFVKLVVSFIEKNNL